MFPRALDGTMMVGMYEAVNSWEHSQLVVMSYGVLLSTVGATAKIIGRKNGLLVLGIALALLLVIPAKFAQHLSTLTMQFAYELGKYLERPQQQAMFYNITSAAMMWVPWLFVDLLQAMGPKEKGAKKTKKKAGKKKD
mmetsp:Transcript_20890/g.43382  ORF Transcript_20890/g.43382 Transcript_20890/m.43382 type:complete len:138 (+) Transcript_20890:78-491(+)